MGILVVDDSKDFRLLMEKMLKKGGYLTLFFADSAEKAFEMLGLDSRKEAVKGIDLVLMDITMKGVDGIEATLRIKAVPALYDIPVIMLTADSERSSLDAAFKAGANDYVVKPPGSVELNARVRSALKLKYEIDARKEAANELRKLSYVVEQNPAPIMILNTERRIEYVNWAFTEDLGYLPEDILGGGTKVLESGVHTEEFYAELWETLSSGRVWRGDICLKRKDGRSVWQLQSLIPVRGEDGHISHFVAVKIDDTERRLAEEALRQREAELHDLTLAMSDLEDRERKNFAEMLHEDIGQNLATMQMSVTNRLPVEKSSGEEGSAVEASEARREFLLLLDTLLKSTIKATRTLTSEIYPSVPYGTGMVDAAQWYGTLFLKQSGAKLAIDLDPGFDRLGDTVKERLLRVIRESFQNIMKHANASLVDVSGTLSEEGLVLSVKDNGAGFSFESIRGKKGRGIGTLLMRERISELGGTLRIDSEPDSGCAVVVRLAAGKLYS